MTEEVVRISRKHQIVVPKHARKKLGLAAGDQLIVGIANGLLVMKPKPGSYTKFMQGLHRDVWKNTDASAYVERERKAWSKSGRFSETSSKGSKR
jgi:AbrB family looped-hinge helix DNA binding protein